MVFRNANEAMAGPGHNPTRPQPTPNKEEPIINFESTALIWGIEKFFTNNGFFLKKIKKGELTIIPPIITNINDGSQSPKKFRKPKTFSGLTILEIVSPIPKTIPLNNEIIFVKRTC